MIPSAREVAILQELLSISLYLKLFSNNVTPAKADTAATYTEVSGGGYIAKTLITANWTYVQGSPSYALYNAPQDIEFTGVTNAPGTVYGYFIVDGANGLYGSARFPDGVVPFSPIALSVIRVLPRILVN